MLRFRHTQEKRVRSFQEEVDRGLSPFRGRKLFPEPDIDDDAILPPLVKQEPKEEEETHPHAGDRTSPPSDENVNSAEQVATAAAMDVVGAEIPADGEAIVLD
jgi:hypothetical protein